MARIEVPMPQMGESIAEGTVSKWLKKIGDSVERDEPILEISTDKVDAEIPSPESGTLVEIRVQEGETVDIGTVVAYVETEAGAGITPPPVGGDPSHADAVPAASEPDTGRAEASAQLIKTAPPSSEPNRVRAAPDQAPVRLGTWGRVAPPEETAQPEALQSAPLQPAPVQAAPVQFARPASQDQPAQLTSRKSAVATADERIRERSTPVVRRIAAEHGVTIADVPGTGQAGRVTKQDILDFIENGKVKAVAGLSRSKDEVAAVPSVPLGSGSPTDLWEAFYGEVQHPEFPVREGDRVEPMDKIRRLTAQHMVVAKRIAPHVHSLIEIDFSRVDRMRRTHKAQWAGQGARVSYTAFVVWACSRLLRKYPPINGTVSGNNIIHRGSINIGIAVDLDPGLIVPAIHGADELSLVGIGKKIIDLADRARSRKLVPQEIQGATFSITNPGVLGTMVGMPIIPKGTSAILGTGAIQKRAIVIEDPLTDTDAVAIRKQAIFSLGYDHRLVDGADAARFLSDLKALLEDFPEDA